MKAETIRKGLYAIGARLQDEEAKLKQDAAILYDDMDSFEKNEDRDRYFKLLHLQFKNDADMEKLSAYQNALVKAIRATFEYKL